MKRAMNKHAPGPWKIVKAIDTWMIASCGDGLIIQSPPCKGDALGSAEANARLIAAAPELLEALKAATEFVDRHSEDWYRSGQALLKSCKAAIAKATGGGDA